MGTGRAGVLFVSFVWEVGFDDWKGTGKRVRIRGLISQPKEPGFLLNEFALKGCCRRSVVYGRFIIRGRMSTPGFVVVSKSLPFVLPRASHVKMQAHN